MANLANENKQTDIDTVKSKASKAIIDLLEALEIDWTADPNTKETPRRVAKMYAEELLAGRFAPMPKVTVFPNTKKVDELYTVGPVPVVGVCSHHFLPISGHVWIGVIPGSKLLGLSKFARLADWVFARPQIQEEATEQLADVLEDLLQPKGLGIICKAEHACMSLRGIKARGSIMTTSVMRGDMFQADAKSEFQRFAI